jgi:hypothetical protein
MIVLATGRNYAAERCGPCHALKIASKRRFLRVLGLSVMYAAGSGAHGRLGKSDRISGKFDYVKLLTGQGTCQNVRSTESIRARAAKSASRVG